MKRIALVSIVLFFSVCALWPQGSGFLAAGDAQRPRFIQESNICFVCGRTPKDYGGLVELLMAAQKQSLSNEETRLSAKQAELAERGNRIDAGITDDNRGALLFPVKTAKRDPQTFKSMIPDLDSLLTYAQAEQLPDDTKLGEVLQRMKQGASAQDQGADAGKLRSSVQLLSALRDQIAKEAFVRVQYSMSDILLVNVTKQDPTSQNIYQKWMRSNQSTIDQIRSNYSTNPELARTQYESLLSQTKTVTPVLLQQALRTGILMELAGQPRASVVVTLCPVCREIFETLNERFSLRYEKPE